MAKFKFRKISDTISVNEDSLFNAGATTDIIPEGDPARQAIDSLRGYAYQALATVLAWIDIGEKDRLYLEVAEDYAKIAEGVLRAAQVKDTKRSGSVTLNSVSVRKAVAAFVDLAERNSDIRVELRFITTSKIGKERTVADRPAGMAGLEYWRKAATGEDISPLRAILESEKFPDSVGKFCKARNDKTLRHDLIKRIHWDCGKPDFQTLRQEIEKRLVVLGRDLFSLPAPEARRLVNYLVCHVLKKSIINRDEDRVLARDDLYQTIDEATRISLPRHYVERLLRYSSDIAASRADDVSVASSLSIKETGWLIDGATLPAPRGIISRVAVESATTNALGNSGSVVITGASGLGKSTVARTVAVTRAGKFLIAHFRNADVEETCHRLDMVFARIGNLPDSPLILEDLDHIEDTRVTLSLACVIGSLRRHYREALITCSREPSLKVLTEVGLNSDCVIDCPYFSEEEACALVADYEGDPDRWGRLAYVAGASGHPQLTHAFVAGMASRNWPVEETEDIFARAISSDDTDATREAAQRRLSTELPEGARDLLYRLSLTTWHFNRSLALAIGNIPPPVSRTGELIDQLVGPWIEAVGKDLFRVSPLARQLGSKMLLPEEQEHIHKNIAIQMLGEGAIDVIDTNIIMMHAILGKSPEILLSVAEKVLSTDSRTLEMITEHLFFFHCWRTDVPVYPKEPLVSGMLRLAQFRLVAATGEGSKISEIVAALFKEVESMPKGEPRRYFEGNAMLVVLNTMDIANHLDDWVTILCRFRNMAEVEDFLKDSVAGYADGSNLFAKMFGIGSASLASVERLEHVINQLDELDDTDRELLLTPADETFSDYSLFINGPWITQQRREDFDAADAATCYRRLAEKTQNWDICSISLQCSVAQAVMLDEYQNNKQGALAVLEELTTTSTPDPIISRAMAKIYWRHGEHRKVLEIIRSIPNEAGAADPVQRMHEHREAAISAAKCGEWLQSEKWFLEAETAARLAQGDDIEAMAVGLRADSAVAAFEVGDVGRALKRLADAIDFLPNINPEATLSTAYCHRVIRHTALWMKSRIKGRDIKVGGEPIGMEVGTCSNPTPSSEIRELPLAHIDIPWYVLAMAETAANLDVGITATLHDRMPQGPILGIEAALCVEKMRADIDGLDADGFANHFISYLEASMYMKTVQPPTSLDPVVLERGKIPELAKDELFSAEAELVAKDAVLAYGIRSVFTNKPEGMNELETAMNKQFTGLFPGKFVFDHSDENPILHSEGDQVALAMIKTLLQNEHVEPKKFWEVGLRLFEWVVSRPNFKDFLMPRLAVWQRSGWNRILTEESFHLCGLRWTRPSIEEILKISSNNQSFIAKLLLATSEAVGSRLNPTFRNTLRVMSEEVQLPQDLS